MKKAVLIILFSISFFSVSAQKTNTGTDFWLAFIGNYDSLYAGRYDSLKLYVSAAQTSQITISIPLQSYSVNYTVPKDSVIVCLIPLHLGYIYSTEVKENKAIHLTSDFPVSVSSMNLLYATTDASIVLPTTNIPKNPKYISVNPSSSYNSAIMLVAPEDSIDITIIPTTNTRGGNNANLPFNIILNRGQLYQILASSDLTGTSIVVNNNKKLIAFSGDKCSNWPCGACDHQYEQIIPEEVLDTAYLVAPHFGHTRGFYTKIVPLDTNTTIKVNNRIYNNVSYKNPLVINTTSGDSNLYVSGTKKFRCYQFLKGAGINCSGYYNSSYGDPAMVCILSAKYFGEKSLFSTVNSFNLKDHYVNIIIHKKSKDNVYFDGLLLDSTEFYDFHYNSNFAYAKILLSDGQHTIECSDGHLAYCYGVGFYESYLYLAGFSLPNFDISFLDSVKQYDCKNKRIKMQFNAQFSSPIKKATWYFGDGTTAVGDPVSHWYDSIGIYKIKVVGENFSNNKDSFIRTININWPIFNPITNKYSCGDTIKYIERSPFFSNFKWQDSSTQNYYNAYGASKKLWVKATDTSGYCLFKDTANYYFTEVIVDSKIEKIDTCHKRSLFVLKDSVKIKDGNILTKIWIIPNYFTFFDSTNIKVHLPMPGKYPVYLDVITEKCKLRHKTEIVVHPNSKVFGKPVNEVFCEGEKFKLYDSSILVTGKFKTIKWLFDDGATEMQSDSLKLITSLPFNGEITRPFKHIAITDKNCSDTFRNQMLIYPKPSVNFLIDIDSQQCLPTARWTYTSQTTTYDDTSALSWNTGNGKFGTNYTMKNIRYFAEGKYKVKLSAKSTYGCQDSMIKYVHVFAPPISKFTINDSAQCLSNNLFEFNNQTTGRNYTYNWRFGNGNNSKKTSPDSITYNNFGNYVVTLTANSPIKDCSDSVSKTIIVTQNPNATFTFNNKEQCISKNIFQFNNSSTAKHLIDSNIWLVDNINYFNKNLSNIKYNTTGVKLIKLTVIDTNGCNNTYTDSVIITPNPLVNLTVNDSIQCLNTHSFVFKTQNYPLDSNTWKLDNITIGNKLLEDSLNVNNLLSGNYKLTLFKHNAIGCNDSNTINFTVLPKPIAQFSINKDSQCLNNNLFTFNNLSTANNDAITNNYFYTINNRYTGSPSLSNISYSNIGQHAISLKIITQENCTDSINKSIEILPTPNFNALNDSVCLYQYSNINAIQLSGNPITQWNWKFSDGSTSNTSPPFSHLFNAAGNYNSIITVTDIYNCTETKTFISAYKIYPLPNANFYFNDFNSEDITAKIQFVPQIILSTNQYLWKFPDASQSYKDSLTKIITEQMKGAVTLKVTNEYQCIDSTMQYVNIFPKNFNFFIPNAFTPNLDENNDELLPIGLKNATNYRFEIYNRWGEKIFLSNDINKGWDGNYLQQPVMEGNYLYSISFRYIDGKTYHYRGLINLLK